MKPERFVEITEDGSPTISIPELQVTYHSRHGAVQESMHVFIKAGLYTALEKFSEGPLSLLEMGLGTGLNAWLTALETARWHRAIHYTALELYPLEEKEWKELYYSEEETGKVLLHAIHSSAWNKDVPLTDRFILKKEQVDLLNFTSTQRFHLVYFDAFAPLAQPELWTKEVFEKLHHLLHDGGLLVTYCSKGDVRRAMLAAGFSVEKLPGPKGKREMLRARK